MELSKRHRGYVRPLPRLTEAGQRLKLAGCGQIYVEGKTETLGDMIEALRKGDIVTVVALYVMAPQKTTYKVKPRDGLWDAIGWIEAKGATILEVQTGRSTATKSERDGMIRDAIEHLTSAGRAASGRKNGAKSPGRKPDNINPDERKRALDVWHDVRIDTDGKAREAGPKGWTLYRYRKHFGPSGRGS
jgi:hypothetical protein